jgi:phenylalanyl-tRNA synthetase alpha chain|tara:strand:- start:39763 stop:40476 length:714 start_codon:yes stop_codon:yes gene_type:complete
MARMEHEGHLHPISRIVRDVNSIFGEMGFSLVLGPEIETEHYNFDALNIPADHPARDMWDTLWLKPLSDKNLLRTHTSPMQVRYMEKNKPPFRIIVPGKVFRHEATDATHEAQFYQLEGLMIDKDISLGHLKGVLEQFFEKFLGSDSQVRFRPSYFPFVEPGVEVDVLHTTKQGTKWLELMGAGMVHPNVLKEVGIDPSEWSGFAFGGGVERLAMVKYGIDDVRLFHTGDLRFVNQF